MRVTYFGHSGFAVAADEQTVLIDPFLTGNPVATTTAAEIVANTILLSHAHNDHGIADALAIAERTGATVITVLELSDWLATQGVQTVPANHGGTVAFSGGSVTFTQAWHSSSYQTPSGETVAIGVPAGLIVRFDGLTMYHTGDTALFSDMRLIGEAGIDVMFVCIGDHFTMGPEDAVRAVQFVQPKIVVPIHYDTFPPIQQDAAAFKKRVEMAVPGVRCVVMRPGNSEIFTAPLA